MAVNVGRNHIQIFLGKNVLEYRQRSFQGGYLFSLGEDKHGLADGYPSHGTDEVSLGWIEGRLDV